MIVKVEVTPFVGEKGRMLRVTSEDKNYRVEMPATLSLRDRMGRRKKAYFHATLFDGRLYIHRNAYGSKF